MIIKNVLPMCVASPFPFSEFSIVWKTVPLSPQEVIFLRISYIGPLLETFRRLHFIRKCQPIPEERGLNGGVSGYFRKVFILGGEKIHGHICNCWC